MNKPDPNVLSIPELHAFYMTLFNIIFRHDDRLRLTAVQVIQKILQTPLPTQPLTPHVQELLRSLQDDLLASPDPSIVSAFSKPPDGQKS
jgi:hypothetical protein